MVDAKEYVGKVATLIRRIGEPSVGTATIEIDEKGPYIALDGRRHRIEPGNILAIYNGPADHHNQVVID